MIAPGRTGPEDERGLPADERSPHDGHRSLRERIADTRWRRRLSARRPVDSTYRLTVALVGAAIVAFGLITIPLPGPGWLTVIAGLVVLATEFLWAERLLRITRRHVARWTAWVAARPVWVRVVLAGLTAAFVYGVLVVVLHLTGVPGWLPGWLPLWR